MQDIRGVKIDANGSTIISSTLYPCSVDVAPRWRVWTVGSLPDAHDPFSDGNSCKWTYNRSLLLILQGCGYCLRKPNTEGNQKCNIKFNSSTLAISLSIYLLLCVRKASYDSSSRKEEIFEKRLYSDQGLVPQRVYLVCASCTGFFCFGISFHQVISRGSPCLQCAMCGPWPEFGNF